MSPEPPPPDEANDGQGELAELSFSARCGERIIGFFSGLTRPAASLLSRQDAIVEGFGAAVGRVLLSAVLIGACILLAGIYSNTMARGRWGPRLPWDKGTEEVLMMILWMCAAGATLIVSWTDWDGKWRVLSWLCFILVASGTVLTRGSQLGVLAVLTGQSAVHWFIHAALRQRDRREEWERQSEAACRRAERAKVPSLAQQYRGHAGFPEPADSGPEATDNT